MLVCLPNGVVDRLVIDRTIAEPVTNQRVSAR